MMDWSSGWYLYSFFGNTGLDFGINDDNVTNHCEWNSTEGDIKGVDIAQAMLDISSSSGFENAVNEDFIKGAKKGSVIAGVSGVWSETELKRSGEMILAQPSFRPIPWQENRYRWLPLPAIS